MWDFVVVESMGENVVRCLPKEERYLCGDPLTLNEGENVIVDSCRS